MNRVSVNHSDLANLVRSILIANGADASEAVVVADAMVWCDLMGRPNYGAWRLPTLIQRLSHGHIKSPCHLRFVKTAPALGILDGDQGFGHFVGHRAMQEAIELARQSGAGLVGVRNSSHFFAAAYYAQLATEAGMIGFAMSNAHPKVAAFRGRNAVLGTNPFAFGAPRVNGRSILVDMSTAASANSLVTKSLEGEDPQSLPEGIAIDKQGRPTRDPRQIGSLLPLAGAKGYGLGLMVEILSGVLTGAGFSHGVKSFYREAGRNGHFFLALDISKYMPLKSFYDRMETLVEFLVASGAPEGQPPVQLPGEHRWQARDQNLRGGIPLDEPTLRTLRELAGKAGLSVPW